MESFVNDIPLYHLLIYFGIGILMFFLFSFMNSYLIPLFKDKNGIIKDYWWRIQLLLWVLFIVFCLIAALRVNLVFTLIILVLIIALAWRLFENIFAGIVLKTDKRLGQGESLSTNEFNGQIKRIGLVKTALYTSDGERILVPNSVLNRQILRVIGKKDIRPVHIIEFMPKTAQDLVSIRQLALLHPMVNANEKIEVSQEGREGLVRIKLSLVDPSFADAVDEYFNHKIQ